MKTHSCDSFCFDLFGPVGSDAFLSFGARSQGFWMCLSYSLFRGSIEQTRLLVSILVRYSCIQAPACRIHVLCILDVHAHQRRCLNTQEVFTGLTLLKARIDMAVLSLEAIWEDPLHVQINTWYWCHPAANLHCVSWLSEVEHKHFQHTKQQL